MEIEQLAGVRYDVPLREGGSLPAVVETDRGGPFVVKFRGAGQGAKALIAELLAAGLALAVGLPVPRPAVVTLAEGFGKAEPDDPREAPLAQRVSGNAAPRAACRQEHPEQAHDPTLGRDV